MAKHLATTSTRRSKRIAIAILIVSLSAAVVVGGGWLYLTYWGHNTAGLEGTWRDPADPKHCYEFRSNGDVATWYGSKDWWNQIGWTATWKRDGSHITVHTDRNWDFEGDLDGVTIRGKMLMRDPSGAALKTTDIVWQKE